MLGLKKEKKNERRILENGGRRMKEIIEVIVIKIEK